MLITALLLTLGCTSLTPKSSEQSTQEQKTTNTAPSKPATPKSCAGIPLLSSKEAMQKSPRKDETAERLALRSSKTLIAADTDIVRVQQDLQAIRLIHPESGTVRIFPHFGTDMLLLEFPPEIQERIKQGSYTDLDCLNQWYGGRINKHLTSTNFVFVQFDSLMHPGRLVEAYHRHPDVWLVEANSYAGDGDDILLCNDKIGGTHRYLFRHGEGMCVSGCASVSFNGYDVSADGTVQHLGKWQQRKAHQSAEPRPEWASESCLQQRKSHYHISPKRPKDQP